MTLIGHRFGGVSPRRQETADHKPLAVRPHPKDFPVPDKGQC